MVGLFFSREIEKCLLIIFTIHNIKLQFYSKLRPPKLRPVFGENAKICHPKIFQTKAGFQMRPYFWINFRNFLNYELKIYGSSEPFRVK